MSEKPIHSAKMPNSIPVEGALELGDMTVFVPLDPKLREELEFADKWRATRRDLGDLAANQALNSDTDT